MRLRLAPTLLACALALGVSARPARATVVEKVVAVVGERAILLSDVRDRAKPFMLKIHAEVPPGAQRNAAISQTYKNVLERMVDEELQFRAANRSKIVVDAKEVDDAIGRVAAQNGLSVDKLIAEAAKSGLDEKAYRGEIRRQVLEAKLLNLRVQGRIRVSEEDVRTMYRRLTMDERRKLGFRAAWIRIDAPAGDKATAKEKRALAESLAAQARSGSNFAALAREKSDDAGTRDRGGELGRLQPGRLAPALDAALINLEPGQVSGAVRVGDSFFVVKLIERDETELPSFEEAKNELGERVYLEKMGKARRTWIEGLRRQTHVEIRM
ncbi:MAG: peptidylprolyl isomerase [Polyangiaceae bacterium]|nr:peptidylprolyl isomerase [Polyangiaceae bacterium]MCL4752836.1 peptidylprolyl isomerase [Myxococcales bacterium]